MHHQHVKVGAMMVESDGWQRPARYTSLNQELEQLQRTVGLCDISPAGKLSLQGNELVAVLESAFGDIGPLDGGVVRVHRLASGSALQGVVLAQLAYDEFMILSEPDQSSSVSESLGGHAGQCAHLLDITSALAGVRIMGPCGHLVLANLTELGTSPETFPDMSCAQAKFAEIHGVLLRLDRGNLLNYDLYFGREFGEYMWDALLEAGEEYKATPFGIEAMARLQSGG